MPTLLQVTAIHPDAQARLNRTYELLYAELPNIDSDWLSRNAKNVDGIVTGGHLGVPNPLMTALPNLKVIGINGVGFDKVDLDLARSRGVRVANTPDVLTDDVADLAVGLPSHCCAGCRNRTHICALAVGFRAMCRSRRRSAASKSVSSDWGGSDGPWPGVSPDLPIASRIRTSSNMMCRLPFIPNLRPWLQRPMFSSSALRRQPARAGSSARRSSMLWGRPGYW